MTTTIRAGAPVDELDAPPSVFASDNTNQNNLSNTTFQAGSPDLGVDFIAPTSGRVLLMVGGGLRDSGGTNRVMIAPEIYDYDTGGTVVEAASISVNSWTNASVNTTNYQYGSRMIISPMDADGFNTALIPGRQYHARVMQAVSGGSTADVARRDIGVVPVPLGHAYGPTFARASDRPPSGIAREPTNQTDLPASATYGDPEVSVSFVAPNSGRVMIIVGGGIRDNTGGGRVFITYELRENNRLGRLIAPNVGDINFARGWTNSGQTTSNYQYGCRVSFAGAPATEQLVAGKRYFARVVLDSNVTTGDVSQRDLFVVAIS